jgi:hypothetical protein
LGGLIDENDEESKKMIHDTSTRLEKAVEVLVALIVRLFYSYFFTSWLRLFALTDTFV